MKNAGARDPFNDCSPARQMPCHSSFAQFTREDQVMALVVCEPCHDCKYTDCVTVCPMDCFYEDASQLYIDPDECIDCMACIPECPVEAIFHEREVPSRWTDFIRIN